MIFLKPFYLLTFFFLFSLKGFSQQKISGILVDKTGVKVEDARFTFIENGKSGFTDEDGAFEEIANLGKLTIVFTVNEEDFTFSYTITEKTSNLGTIYLPITVLIDVKIQVDKEEIATLPPIDLQKLPFSTEKFLIYSTAATSNNELTNNYNVRGGNYDENLVYVDGFLVNRPFLTRSGQQEGLSFINTALVKDISFSGGGFHSMYGDKLSSVLAIKYKNPKEFHASVLAGLMGVELHLEDVLGKSSRWSYLLGLRYRANGYLLNSLPAKGSYNPVFWDAQTLIKYEINEFWSWKTLAHYSSNRYQFAPETQKTDFGTANEAYSFNIYFDGKEDTKFQTGTFGTSLEYEKRNVTAKTFFTYFSTNEQERFDIQGQYFINELETDASKETFGDSIATVGVGTFLNHARNQLTAQIFSVYHDGKWKITKSDSARVSNQLFWGIGTNIDQFQDILSEWRMIDSAGFSLPQNTPNDLDLFEVIKGSLSLKNVRSNAYLHFRTEWKIKQKPQLIRLKIRTLDAITKKEVIRYVIDTTNVGNARLIADVGVRGLYTTFNNEAMLMPRASLSYFPVRYLPNKSVFSRRLVIWKLSTGFYHQPPLYREFRRFDASLNANVKAQKSAHIVLGHEYNFSMWQREKPFKLNTEVYYKYLWDVNPYEIENVRIRYYADNIATAYATGADIILNGEFIPGLISFFKVGVLSTKEDVKNDQYTLYYNAAGERIYFGYTEDDVVTDSVVVSPKGIRRPSDQRLNISVLFQDKMPGLESLTVQMGLNFGSPLPYGPPDFTRYKDTLTIKSYFRVDMGMTYDFLHNNAKVKKEWMKKMDAFSISAEVFNLLGINNVLSKQWIQDISGKYYSIPNYLTARRFNLKLIIRI